MSKLGQCASVKHMKTEVVYATDSDGVVSLVSFPVAGILLSFCRRSHAPVLHGQPVAPTCYSTSLCQPCVSGPTLRIPGSQPVAVLKK